MLAQNNAINPHPVPISKTLSFLFIFIDSIIWNESSAGSYTSGWSLISILLNLNDFWLMKITPIDNYNLKFELFNYYIFTDFLSLNFKSNI